MADARRMKAAKRRKRPTAAAFGSYGTDQSFMFAGVNQLHAGTPASSGLSSQAETVPSSQTETVTSGADGDEDISEVNSVNSAPGVVSHAYSATPMAEQARTSGGAFWGATAAAQPAARGAAAGSLFGLDKLNSASRSQARPPSVPPSPTQPTEAAPQVRAAPHFQMPGGTHWGQLGSAAPASAAAQTVPHVPAAPHFRVPGGALWGQFGSAAPASTAAQAAAPCSSLFGKVQASAAAAQPARGLFGTVETSPTRAPAGCSSTQAPPSPAAKGLFGQVAASAPITPASSPDSDGMCDSPASPGPDLSTYFRENMGLFSKLGEAAAAPATTASPEPDLSTYFRENMSLFSKSDEATAPAPAPAAAPSAAARKSTRTAHASQAPSETSDGSTPGNTKPDAEPAAPAGPPMVAHQLDAEASLAYKAKEYAAAAAKWGKAVGLGLNQEPRIFSNLAAAQIMLHQFDQAFVTAHGAFQRWPSHARTHLRMVQACLGCGDASRAAQAAMDAVNACVGTSRIAAQAASNAGLLKEALPKAGRLIRHALLCEQSLASMQAGKLDSAELQLKEARQLVASLMPDGTSRTVPTDAWALAAMQLAVTRGKYHDAADVASHILPAALGGNRPCLGVHTLNGSHVPAPCSPLHATMACIAALAQHRAGQEDTAQRILAAVNRAMPSAHPLAAWLLEIITAVTARKAAGNAQFKTQSWAAAETQYTGALDLLEVATRSVHSLSQQWFEVSTEMVRGRGYALPAFYQAAQLPAALAQTCVKGVDPGNLPTSAVDRLSEQDVADTVRDWTAVLSKAAFQPLTGACVAVAWHESSPKSLAQRPMAIPTHRAPSSTLPAAVQAASGAQAASAPQPMLAVTCIAAWHPSCSPIWKHMEKLTLSCLRVSAAALGKPAPTAVDLHGAALWNPHMAMLLLCNRAAVHMGKQAYEAAVRDCTAALRIGPDYVRALVRRARAYVQLGKAAERKRALLRGTNTSKPLPVGATDDFCVTDFNKAIHDLQRAHAVAASQASGVAEELRAVQAELEATISERDAGLQAADRRKAARRAAASARARTQRENTRPAGDPFGWAGSAAAGGSKPGHGRGGAGWGSAQPGAGARPKQQQQQQQQQRPRHPRGRQGYRAYEEAKWEEPNFHAGRSPRGHRHWRHDGGHSSRNRPHSADATTTRKASHYSVLGLLPDCSSAEVKKAYHKAARRWHPDKADASNAAQVEEFTAQFKLVSEAYEVLSDTVKRRVYDREHV